MIYVVFDGEKGQKSFQSQENVMPVRLLNMLLFFAT
jgi:hypothetical protein